jgi:hypothetical protein
MSLLRTIQEFALPLETSEFYRNIGIFLGCLILVTGGIMYYHHTETTALRISLQKIYKTQQEAKIILEKQKVVTKQREEINTVLEEDKNFKLKNFFDEMVSRLNLSSYQVKEAEVSDDILQKLYTEIKINVQFRGLSTKQLCELLQAIEQKARVYTKELTIIKKNDSLDVTLTIATLKSAISTTKKG